ncbi:MAG: hypothetical protein ABI587_13490 [Gemmatimonadales bacterium]
MTRRRPPLLLLLLVLLSHPLLAQRMDLRAEVPSATLGDAVTFLVTVEISPGQELLETAPRVMLNVPDGVRLLGIDTLRGAGDRIWRGKLRLAFYRVGEQPVPILGLLYRASPGGAPDTLLGPSLRMVIASLAPEGNPQLKDIKPLISLVGPAWGPLAGLLVLMVAAAYWLWRRGGGRRMRIVEPVNLPRGPFATALARLDALSASLNGSTNGVAPFYADVADVLRDCLLAAGAIPHPGLTTPELSRALPSVLAAGNGRVGCERLLREADLVKFARIRPDRPAAIEHLGRARELLQGWEASATAPEVADAVR